MERERGKIVGGGATYPGWVSQLFLHLANRLHKNKTLARLLEPPCRAIFSPYKHFGSPSRVNSVKARQSEHARTLLARGRGKDSAFFSCKRSLKLTRLEGCPFFSGTTFLHIIKALDSSQTVL